MEEAAERTRGKNDCNPVAMRLKETITNSSQPTCYSRIYAWRISWVFRAFSAKWTWRVRWTMVVIFRPFLMRLLAMEDGRNVDSPH